MWPLLAEHHFLFSYVYKNVNYIKIMCDIQIEQMKINAQKWEGGEDKIKS